LKTSLNMRRNGDGRLTLYIIRECLQAILIISITEAVLSVYLYSNHWVDSTIIPSEILIILSVSHLFRKSHKAIFSNIFQALLSIIHSVLHSFLAHRYQWTSSCRVPLTKLSSFCSHMPRFMVLSWMVTSAAGLIVAARQPKCPPGYVMQYFWKMGESCRLHRTQVGLTVLAL
jgi:hypothetical protein